MGFKSLEYFNWKGSDIIDCFGFHCLNNGLIRQLDGVFFNSWSDRSEYWLAGKIAVIHAASPF